MSGHQWRWVKGNRVSSTRIKPTPQWVCDRCGAKTYQMPEKDSLLESGESPSPDFKVTVGYIPSDKGFPEGAICLGCDDYAVWKVMES